MRSFPRLASWSVGAATAMAIGSVAQAIERFPPPDFTTHQLPTTTPPAPPWAGWPLVDSLVLIVALVLGTWIVLGRRSRRGIMWLALGSMIYFGFFRLGCVCSIGSIQNVAMGLAEPTYAVPLVVLVFFAAPLLLTLLAGRVFCAGACPHGALQDWLMIRSIRVPGWLDTGLGVLAHLYLGLAVLFAATGAGFIICQYDPYIAVFRLDGNFDLIVFTGLFVVVSMFIGRPYCRWFCPLGAVFGVLSPFARRHVRIYPDHCIECGLCEASCPVNAIETPEPDTVDPEQSGRRRNWALMAAGLLPVLVVVGVVTGRYAGPGLAGAHPKAALLEQLVAVEAGQAEPTDATEAFRTSGRSMAEARDEAEVAVAGLVTGAGWVGGYMGLVIGMKLLLAARRRNRGRSFEIDRGRCVGCGRCFEHCPSDPSCKVQLTGLAVELDEADDEQGGSGADATGDQPSAKSANVSLEVRS